MKPRAICFTCNGSGTIQRRYRDGNGHWQSQTITCPACSGTGEKP